MTFVLVSIAAHCATTPGQPYSSSKTGLPTVQPEMSRIFIYRPSGMYGYATRPDIFLDGKRVGTSEPGTILYVDVAPGNHDLTIPKVIYSGESKLPLNSKKGQTIYIKNSIGLSATVGQTNIELIEPTEALKEIEELKLINQKME